MAKGQIVRDIDALGGRNPDSVHPAQGGEEYDGHSRRRGKAADGEASLDDTAHAGPQGIAVVQFEGGAAQVVGPVVAFHLGNVADVPLGAFVELQGGQFHDAVGFGTVSDVDAFVDGETGNLAQLVGAMGAYGADPVGAEGDILGALPVDGFKFFDTFHMHAVSRYLR